MTLAHVAAVGVEMAGAARYRTAATIVGQQKLEELRAEAELDDVALAVEHRDGSGVKVCDAVLEPCAAAVVTARWSVAPAASNGSLVMIRVVVSHAHRNYGNVRSFAIRPRRIR